MSNSSKWIVGKLNEDMRTSYVKSNILYYKKAYSKIMGDENPSITSLQGQDIGDGYYSTLDRSL